MNKSQRLLQMIMTISKMKKFNIRDLTDEFHVSKRTILRDLQQLSELGVPLYSELGVNGGYQLLNEKRLPPLYFSEQEAAGIFFIAESLRYYKKLPFDAEIESALKKFYHYLPSDSKKRIDLLRSRVMFWVPPREWDNPFLSELLAASLSEQVMTMTYESEKGVSERDIQCIGVFTMNGFWYCPSYCFKSGSYRTFRADRVLSLRIANNQEQRAKFSHPSIQDWVSSNIGASRKEEGLTVIIHLSGKGVVKCRSDAWFSQELAIFEDGTGKIERVIAPSDVPCLLDTVIAYGADAVLQQPAELRELLVARIHELTKLYT